MKQVNNFYLIALKIQKKGISIKPFFKILLRFFKQFFKTVMEMLQGFERMVKNDASQYTIKLATVFKFMKIIDSNTQIITFFIKKSDIVYKDAQDMALAIAS